MCLPRGDGQDVCEGGQDEREGEVKERERELFFSSEITENTL